MFSVQQGTPVAELGIEQHDEGGVVVLAVSGELDVATIGQLRDALDAVHESGAVRLVVDLTGVTFVDSVSLAALLTASRRVGDDGRFALVVQRNSYGMLVFEAGGMRAVLPLFETRAEALAHARG